MDLDTSAKTINTQTDIKVAELEEIIYRDVYFQRKCWSQLPTSPYTVSHAEGLLNNTMSRIPLYDAKMIEIGIFQVTYVGPKNVVPDCMDDTNVQDCTIPIFTKIRTVTVDTCGTMFCSCCLFERQGLPCTHQARVAGLCHESVGSTFPGFTHHDIHVHWRSDYMNFAYKKTTPPDMYIKYHRIAIKSSGPNL
jgi:hypothetical protein